MTKHKYYGVNLQYLEVPCTATGKKSDIESAFTWTGPGTPIVTKGSYVTTSYSQLMTMTETLTPAKNGTYTCGVEFNPNPYTEDIELYVLSKFLQIYSFDFSS